MNLRTEYAVEVLPGLPADVDSVAFARPGRSTHSEGFIVHVRPEQGRDWIGNFQRGDGALSTWAPTPEPRSLLVIAGGTGYLVSVGDPEQFELLPSYPVRFVATIAEAGLIVVADFDSLVAIDESGVRWVSARVAWDDLTIDEAGPKVIRGHSVDPGTGREAHFVLETPTGRLLQGRAVRS